MVFVNDSISYDIDNGNEIQICSFTPSSDGIFYVKGNNLFYAAENQIKSNSSTRVTSSGNDGEIFNGIPDWVYEEEVFGTDAATWFSPNGDRFAYAQFDDGEVSEFRYELYEESNNDSYPYPKQVSLRYPKVNPNEAINMNF